VLEFPSSAEAVTTYKQSTSEFSMPSSAEIAKMSTNSEKIRSLFKISEKIGTN
jgi:hypothetical protein